MRCLFLSINPNKSLIAEPHTLFSHLQQCKSCFCLCCSCGSGSYNSVQKPIVNSLGSSYSNTLQHLTQVIIPWFKHFLLWNSRISHAYEMSSFFPLGSFLYMAFTIVKVLVPIRPLNIMIIRILSLMFYLCIESAFYFILYILNYLIPFSSFKYDSKILSPFWSLPWVLSS